jgi:hypothetical protein
MTRESREPERADEELKEALKDALAAPFDEVDWEALHGRILADAETRVTRRSEPAVARVAAWSTRGIPMAAAALAAAVVALWIAPAPHGETTPPPEFWPVAEALMSTLPEDTRLLLDAGRDVESMLMAMVVNDG